MMDKQKKKTEILLFPTDTVPGIGCFLSRDCITKLRKRKKRPANKPFPLLLSDKKDIKNYAAEIPPGYEKLKKFLPGGLTLIFKGKKELPKGVLSKEGKVGIRIPDHKKLRKFIRKNKKPLIATSANISGRATPKSLKDVDFQVDRIIEGKSGSGTASTVLDISEKPPVLYRKGAIPIMEIEKITGQEVKLEKKLDFNVLFVCTGNLCRSPMAEIHLKELTRDLKKVNINSAGITAITGTEIYKAAEEVLKESKLKTKHTSKLLTKPLLELADLILVMEDMHKTYIKFLSPQSKNKIFFLRNFKTNKRNRIITDPAGKNSKACKEAFELIKESNKRVEKYLRNKF
jgi:L-threonylcarbamoyladenylate synthase